MLQQLHRVLTPLASLLIISEISPKFAIDYQMEYHRLLKQNASIQQIHYQSTVRRHPENCPENFL